MKFLRLGNRLKVISVFFTILLFVQIFGINLSYAITSGPSMPEVSSFEPATTTEMVDLFSGDFTYNIPLFELPGPNGGYPFNMAYHAGIGMDQEASWVGLGWNLSPGSITREVRGLPDEFNGDFIRTKTALRPSYTVGVSAGADVEIFGGSGVGAKIGATLLQNNYNGFSFSIDGSLGYSKAFGNYTTGLDLGFSLSGDDGVSLDPSLSLSKKSGEKCDDESVSGSVSLGLGYNSMTGLRNMSLGFSNSYKSTYQYKEEKEKRNYSRGGYSSSSAISLAGNSYTPGYGQEMINNNISLTVKPGGAFWGVFAAPYTTGFYNRQSLRNNNKWQSAPAYGYMNSQNANKPKALLDINREQDGAIRKESPNLAVPVYTYDIYNLNGQGISGMFRAYRNDISILHDPKVMSSASGFSAGVDAAPALTHVGVNYRVNMGESVSGPWTDKDGQIKSVYGFEQENPNDTFEPWYFKVHGESYSTPKSVMDKIGNDKAIRVALQNVKKNPDALGELEDERGWSSLASYDRSSDRIPRNQIIQAFKNEDILKDGEEIISLFKVDNLSRDNQPLHHFAGMIATTPEGVRYVYGLPAYNLEQEETQFSVAKQPDGTKFVNVGSKSNGDPAVDSGSDRFLKRTRMPAYAYAYHLTAIVGPDYVDVDNNGVSENDLGYWVKFTYEKASDEPYQWRSPFSKAIYNEGFKTNPDDDRGSYTYGKKEIWNLVKAETKSHIANFILERRDDGYGVNNLLQDNDDINSTAALYALKEIELTIRNAPANFSMKRVKFEYDYSLCSNVKNNINGEGKLTLKKLWFEYGTSERGKLNPYQFTYDDINPVYDEFAYDRWGNYKPYANIMDNTEFPYVNQSESQENIHSYAASWSLKEIYLPTGGKILVDYESDDYAYVQNKQAMHMTEIYVPGLSNGDRYILGDGDEEQKVYFKLKQPLNKSVVDDPVSEFKKYIDISADNIYFKSKINLRKQGEGQFDFVSGYIKPDFSKSYGLYDDGSAEYKYGFFYLKKEKGHHPMSMKAWQHLRSNQPKLATTKVNKLSETDNTKKQVDQIRSMGSLWKKMKEMFQGYYNYCSNEKFGRELEIGKSWLKVKTPDKQKFGGGIRVRQLTYSDEWQREDAGIYGQVYDYTMEEDGERISSGVASYEPMIGGDENPLKSAKEYEQAFLLRSNNKLFFEYPFNETYFPGPMIGYRQVTVKSLAAASLAGDLVLHAENEGLKIFPDQEGISFGTTGMSIHEFYTAKDFPVILDETEREKRHYTSMVPIPFVGTINTSHLTVSQGYSIITNDMHGKLKKVSNYMQNNDGTFNMSPVSYVQYNYQTKERTDENGYALELDNTFTNVDENSIEKHLPRGQGDMLFGQETEFFLDMRESSDISWTGGLSFNVDVLFFFFFTVGVAIPWPSAGKDDQRLRTVVTNKVIFKKGIVTSIEAFDGGSTVVTENLKWDKTTGEVILTSAKNDFDDPVYSYSIPAWRQYTRMGPAYANQGLSFTLSNTDQMPYKSDLFRADIPTEVVSSLAEGDELLLFDEQGTIAGKAIFTGKEDEEFLIYCSSNLSGNYTAKIARSGNRNLLGVSAGNITALEDPTKGGVDKVYIVDELINME